MKNFYRNLVATKIKKTFLIIICIIILITASLSTTVATEKQVNSNYKPKILQNIKREKRDISTPIEINKGEYTNDKSKLINDKSKALLTKLGIQADNIKSVSVIEDTVLNKTFNNAELDNTNASFDQNGNLTKMINYADMST